MRQKVFYRFNQSTGRYERVFPSRKDRVGITLRNWGISLLGSLVLIAFLYYLVDFPRERELRKQNQRLEARIEIMNRQADEALAVMEDIAERDNNFYRVMMQSEPLSPARRYAGLERQRNLDRMDSLSDNALVATVGSKLDRLDQMLFSQINSFDYLAKEAGRQKDRIAHIPAIQPVPEKFLRTMASGYGVRRDPIYGTTKFHEGLDFSAPIGTPVYATADGIVTNSSWKSAYGNLIEIDHGYNYSTRYAHLSKFNVKAGQSVCRGDLIGYVGNTGKSTGPHLHYEVRHRGEPQNPVNYYFYDITPEQYDELVRLAENAGHVMD